MKSLILLMVILSVPTFAQEKFELKNASNIYDVAATVESCKNGSCEGKLKIELFTKTPRKSFQTFNLETTAFSVEEAETVNTKILYDSQSMLFFEDYNFDGTPDLAVRDGSDGGYGGPSYQVYLFSPRRKKFVYSSALSDLNHGVNLGMMNVSARRKVLRVFSKDGCCWHETEEYQVVDNRPKKIFDEVEDARAVVGNKVKITTRKLVRGHWRTSVKYVKREK